jgi:hypothetical protein
MIWSIPVIRCSLPVLLSAYTLRLRFDSRGYTKFQLLSRNRKLEALLKHFETRFISRSSNGTDKPKVAGGRRNGSLTTHKGAEMLQSKMTRGIQ